MVRAAGFVLSVAYMALIVWLVRSSATDCRGGHRRPVLRAGANHADEQALQDALAFFRRDAFPEARAAFDRSDPRTVIPVSSSTSLTATTVKGGAASITTMHCSARDSRRSIARSPLRRTTASSSTTRRSGCTRPTNSRRS